MRKAREIGLSLTVLIVVILFSPILLAFSGPEDNQSNQENYQGNQVNQILAPDNQDTLKLDPWGVSIASGTGLRHIVPIRVGIQKAFERRWGCESGWPIWAYAEASFYSLNGEKSVKVGSHHQLQAGALAGVFRIEREAPTYFGWPYFEAGVGASWLSQKEICGRELGMRFEFEDRFGAGLRFGKKREYDIGLRFIHFSNAYTSCKNNGINLYVLVLGYWFE